MYEGIYLVFIRSLCIFVDILTVCYTFILFFNIKYEYNITLRGDNTVNIQGRIMVPPLPSILYTKLKY